MESQEEFDPVVEVVGDPHCPENRAEAHDLEHVTGFRHHLPGLPHQGADTWFDTAFLFPRREHLELHQAQHRRYVNVVRIDRFFGFKHAQ